MSIGAWIILYLGNLLFWLWICLWKGAELLDGTFISGLLVHWRAATWGKEGLQLFGWVSIVVSTVWFCLGIFNPGFRFLTIT